MTVRSFRRFALAACAAVSASSGVLAQTMAANLADLSLEQLSNIEVTSVAKRVQRLADVAGSVYVISGDDIRRSGAASLPQALRLAPNLNVARADANQYAVTARGFNSVLANKMLVLVDGRTVYSPLFSGVFWEAQDLLMEDIERIEVLSGGGGTLYGSNAVNGVISIITRSAADTHGTLASVAYGTEDKAIAARHGGQTAAGVHWRAYAKRSLRANTEQGNGTAIRDGSARNQAGFRADQSNAGDQFTVQGDVYESRIDQAPAARRIAGLNLLGRWSRDEGNGAHSQVQAYVDRTERDQPGSIRERLVTWDVEYQRLSRPLAGHELLWGAGWRLLDDQVDNLNPAVLAFNPASRRLNLWNLFAQDEIEVAKSAKATLGVKVEHNDYTGAEWMPNARLAWEPMPNHLLWAAVSRSVRTPSRIDREFFAPGSPPFAFAGGPSFDSEVARVAEIGWRGQPVPALSYSLTVFHHDFRSLRSQDATPGGATLNNNFSGRLKGVEGWGRWRLTDRLRLNAGFVHQRGTFEAAAGTAPIGGVASLGNDPRNRLMLGSSMELGANVELDVQVRRVGALPNPLVPAYTALDVRLGWRVRPDLELSITGRNLGDPRHPEWGTPANRAEIERNLLFKAVWRM